MSSNIERNKKWAKRLSRGETLQSIGDSAGVTREAVRVALISDGLYSEAIASSIMVRSAEKAAGAKRRAEEAQARMEQRKRVTSGRQGRERVITDEALIEAMRAWMADGGSGVSMDWPGPGSVSLINLRFGSWNGLRRAAGCPPEHQSREYRKRFPVEECVSAVAAFLCDDDWPYKGSAQYDKWARQTAGRPSAATVRLRFKGSWLAAKAAAIAALGWD